jgi:hypothetical protein
MGHTQPWGTSAFISLGIDISPSTETQSFLPKRASLFKRTENSNLEHIHSKPLCHVQSKAFSISTDTAAADILLLKFWVTWYVSLVRCHVVLWRAWNSNWLALSMPLPSMCLWNIFSISFSYSFPVVDKKVIGLRFWENLGSLQGFGKIVTFAFLQDVAKCECRMRWLVKCTY